MLLLGVTGVLLGVTCVQLGVTGVAARGDGCGS